MSIRLPMIRRLPDLARALFLTALALAASVTLASVMSFGVHALHVAVADHAPTESAEVVD